MRNSVGGRRGHCDSMSAGSATAPKEARPCHDGCRTIGCSDRLAAIAESATLAVDAKAKALQAQGEAVIGFGAGEPDFPTPDAHRRGRRRGLPRPARTTATRRPAACPSSARRSPSRPSATAGSTARPSQVLVTNGGKHAVFTAFAALCDPGDEVICPAPYWTTYPEAITLAGGVPKVIDTTEETGFQVTVDQLEAAYTERTKVLLFVSPDNPSGAVYPPEQVAAIGQWAVERGVWVITDEIYEHLTYGPHEFASMPALVPDIAEQCIDRQRRRQDLRHDRLARRLDDRPARRRPRRRPTSRATPRRTSSTSPSGPRSPRSAATSRPWR